MPGTPGPKLVAGAFDRLSEALMVTQTHPHQIQYRLLHGDLDLLSFTSRVTLHERRQNADDAMHARAGIADTRPGKCRRIHPANPVTLIAPPIAWAIGS